MERQSSIKCVAWSNREVDIIHIGNRLSRGSKGGAEPSMSYLFLNVSVKSGPLYPPYPRCNKFEGGKKLRILYQLSSFCMEKSTWRGAESLFPRVISPHFNNHISRHLLNTLFGSPHLILSHPLKFLPLICPFYRWRYSGLKRLTNFPGHPTSVWWNQDPNPNQCDPWFCVFCHCIRAASRPRKLTPREVNLLR